MALEYRSPTDDELRAVLRTTHTAFGEEVRDDEVERLRKVLPLDRVLAAWDVERPVGVTASYPFELTVPGGQARAAGVTLVGVLPSHRRRGILRELALRQFEDVHERGESVAILYASESRIYERFGYGLGAPSTRLDAVRSAFGLRDDPGVSGTARLVSADEAVELFPPIYERLRQQRAGFLGRTRDWWTEQRLADPEQLRDGGSPKYYVLLEFDGEPVAYAIYRIVPRWDDSIPRGTVHVFEAFALSPAASRELWRFLFGIDLVESVVMRSADPAMPLFLSVEDPRRLHPSINDGLWLRLVDVEAALRARRFEKVTPAVLELTDSFLTRNAGRFSIGHEPERTKAAADVALDVTDLAAAYLGAFSFEQLAAAGRATELRPGGIARATALFAAVLPPYCPENF